MHNAIQNIDRNVHLKFWTVWDELTENALDLTHEQFKDGLNNNYIKLSGEFKIVEHNIK